MNSKQGTNLNKKLTSLTIIPAILLLQSCNEDLEKVAKFGETSAQFKVATSDMATDIYLSCVRSNHYIRLVNTEAIKLKLKSFEDCETQNKEASKNVNTANQVITTYIETLGNVAGNEQIPFDKSFNAIGSVLKSITITRGVGLEPFTLKPDFVDAGIGIANFLTGLLSTEVRRSAVKKAIICTDNNFQTYGQGLILIYREAYLNGLLALEASRINDYYPSYAAILINRNAPPLDRMKLESEYNNSLESISKRKDSAEAYLSVVESTRIAHKSLRDMFVNENKLDELEINNICQDYLKVSNNSKTSNLINSKFKTLDRISRREKVFATKIIFDYQEKIAPQINKIVENSNQQGE